jgi:hypothetical protein
VTKLTEGRVYHLTYKLQSGNGQWWMYQATMTYLGLDQRVYKGQSMREREAFFNLRPLAGTQALRISQIVSAEEIGTSQGRDDARHRMPRKLGRA